MIDIESYKKNGFLILRDFFTPETVGQIKDEALSIFDKQIKAKAIDNQNSTELEKLTKLFNEDFKSFVSSGKHIQHMISLHRLSLSSDIEKVIKLLGVAQPNICTRPVLYFNHKQLAKEDVYHTVFAHQDWRSMQGSINSVVCWVPLVDIDKNLGALEVVPGSHLQGLITEEVLHGFGSVTQFHDSDFLSVEMKAGDILIFNSFLVHRSGQNTRQDIRWSCHFRYNDMSETTFIDRGFPHPYIYKPDDQLLTPAFDTKKAVNEYFS